MKINALRFEESAKLSHVQYCSFFAEQRDQSVCRNFKHEPSN